MLLGRVVTVMFFVWVLGDSMTDGSVLPERQVNLQWDGAWDGRTQVVEEGWSAEFFVPWSMMQLPQGDIEGK